MLNKLLSAALLSMVVLTTFSGCKKSDDTAVTPSTSNERFTVTIDGIVFTPPTSSFFYTNDTVVVSGTESTPTKRGKTVTLSFPKALGTYTVASSSKTVFSYAKDSTSAYLAAKFSSMAILGSGTVNVTAVSSNNVKGTFSFTAVSFFGPTSADVTATNGSFNITQ